MKIIRDFSTIERKLIDLLKSQGYGNCKLEIDINAKMSCAKSVLKMTEKTNDGNKVITEIPIC